MNPVISVQNLKKSYPKPKDKGVFEAVKGISFEVLEGEIFGILGPNGAGKTTTLEIIEGLSKQTQGKVTVLGLDNIIDGEKIKSHIGVQLQSSEYLPFLSLEELLELFSSLYTQSPSRSLFDRERNSLAKDTEEISRTARNGTIELLKLVGLEDKKNFEVKNLSGGQKQRFTIATSLVHNPKILFLDEPTTGLDPKARRDLWALIKNLNNQGMTIVLTTHYMEEAEFLCHRVAILDQGKILQIDEPRKLVEDLSHTTQVAFLTEEKLDPGLFSNVPGIEKIYNDYPKVVLEIKDLDHISQIVQLLKKNKIAFSGFSVKTASLEDVYLDLTGRQFGETYE
jgi:ABC-2 type transport system ATP-binding protein